MGTNSDNPVNIESTPICMEFNVKQAMRDGVNLAADIYRPNVPDPVPVLLIRTCYSSAEAPIEVKKKTIEDYKFFAQHGYAVVIQDVRGKNNSDGYFNPIFQEELDGFDSQTWCGIQPWSNGNVGTLGGSYLAWTQMMAAPLRNPYVKTMIWLVPPNDPFSNLPYRGGAFSPAQAAWAAVVDGRKNQSLLPFENLNALYAHVPLIDVDRAFGRNIPWLREWLIHDQYDDFWKRAGFNQKFPNIAVPVLHISGWFDDVGIGAQACYIGLRTRGYTSLARENQKLIVGPWLHNQVGAGRSIGSIDFGEKAVLNLREIELRWFDYWLKGIKNGIMTEPRVQLFIMGVNRWRGEDEWPLQRTHFIPYYLHPAGQLSHEKPSLENSFDRYAFNPRDPPCIAEPFPFQMGGPADRRSMYKRSDILLYQSSPVEQEFEVTGPLKMVLYCASSTPDTDFVATLVDIFPDGYAMWLNDGIIRARFRESYEKEVPLIPNQVYSFHIDLMWTANIFIPGHRIGIEISSGRFPASSPNSNMGRKEAYETEYQIAQQTIYHSEKYSSHIILPIIPRSSM